MKNAKRILLITLAVAALGAGCPTAAPTPAETTPTPTVTPPVETPVDEGTLGMVVDPADTVNVFLESYLGDYPDSARDIAGNTMVGEPMQDRLAAGSTYDLLLCNQEVWQTFELGPTNFTPTDPSATTLNPTQATIDVEFSQVDNDDSTTAIYTMEASDNFGWQISNVSCPDLE